MIFVDTSVLIDFLRGRKTTAAERLRALERDNTPILIPAVCYQEILQGAKDEREWALLRSNLDTQRISVPIDLMGVHREAARIFFDCRKRGLTIRSSVDCFIAAQVLESKGTLLHADDDFDRIAKARRLSVLRS